MKRPPRRNGTGWLICAAVALAICTAVVLYERSYAQWSLTRILSDGFFVAGVLLLGFGALVWVANFGGFTALGYGWYLLVRKLSASRARFEERLSYLEYVRQNREKTKNPTCIFGTGLICVAIAGVFLYFY